MVGVLVGLVPLTVMFLPSVVAGDHDEIGDPLVFFALPFLVLCAGVGAMIGATPRAAAGPEPGAPSWTVGRLVVLVGAGAIAVLAVRTMAWAMGFVDVSPLGPG